MTFAQLLASADKEKRYELEERAAILQHCANMPREFAESLIAQMELGLRERRGDHGRATVQSDYPD